MVRSAALTPHRAACSPRPVGCPPVEQVLRDFLAVLLGSGMPMAIVEGGGSRSVVTLWLEGEMCK